MAKMKTAKGATMPQDRSDPADTDSARAFGDEVRSAAGRAAPESPNILVIMSDEHHWGLCGFNGHKVVETPNLDRLAARGVNFTNAYCNSPLCSPSRQSCLAGRWPHRIGMWNNCCAMPENTVTWAHALSLAGYETALCGKMHFNGYQKLYGFERRPVLESNEAGELFHSYGIRTSHDWTQPLPYRSHGGRNVDDSGADTDERLPIFRHDRRIVEGCLAELRAKATSPDGRPLALVCGTVLPHPPFRARRDLFERYAGRADLPVNIHGEGLGDADRSLRRHQRMETNDYSADDIRRLRQAYFGLITEFDEYVGQLLGALEETGLAGNTVVIYCSDHGDMAGEHGMVGKCSMRESSARVPMIFSWPGRFPEGRTVDAPVSLVDLYPTLLEISGGSLPPILAGGLDGHSLLPLIEGRAGDFRGNGVFCEFEGEGWNHPRCFLREGPLKYVYNHTAAHELYDLASDPLEQRNLIADPARAADARRLRSRIESFWDGAAVERQVLETQARQKIAYCRNVCGDLGW